MFRQSEYQKRRGGTLSLQLGCARVSGAASGSSKWERHGVAELCRRPGTDTSSTQHSKPSEADTLAVCLRASTVLSAPLVLVAAPAVDAPPPMEPGSGFTGVADVDRGEHASAQARRKHRHATAIDPQGTDGRDSILAGQHTWHHCGSSVYCFLECTLPPASGSVRLRASPSMPCIRHRVMACGLACARYGRLAS